MGRQLRQVSGLILCAKGALQLSSNPAHQHQSGGASSHGYGLGLGIVQRLCERHGWLFALHVDGSRVAASISW